MLLGAAVCCAPAVDAQELTPLPPVESAPATNVIATPSTSTTTGPAANLSQADVERIVADYLARRDAPANVVHTGHEAPPNPPPLGAPAPLPMPSDDLPPPQAPAPPAGYVVGTDKHLSATWNHGLELQSPNKDFRVHVGGRTQFDTSFFAGDESLEAPVPQAGIGDLSNSMQFRRARLRVDGLIYEQYEFAFEYEFSNDVSVDFGPTPPIATAVPAVTDAWINFRDLPLIDGLKVGNQKNPIGFEHLESSRYLDFIERSFNQDLFYGPFNNGFSPGILAYKEVFDGHGSWFAGVFAANMTGNTNIYGYGLGNDYAYTMRGTLLPYFEQDGRYMIHLGTSYEYRDADDGRVRVRSRGNLRNGPPGPFNAVYADTTSLAADDQQLLNFEAVYQCGSLLIQSEYCFSQISNATQVVGVAAPTGVGNVFLHGGYIEALYFLTGEHRAYSKERAGFDRVIPHANAFRVLTRDCRVCQGLGAWQVGIRYAHADLNNSGVNGGMLNSITFGVNWFFNPNMKFQINYDWTHRGMVTRFSPAGAISTVGSGDVFGLGTRLAIDF